MGSCSIFWGQQKIPVLQTDYTDQVSLRVILPASQEAGFRRDVTEVTSGKADVQTLDSLYFAELDGRVLMGDDLRGEP